MLAAPTSALLIRIRLAQFPSVLPRQSLIRGCVPPLQLCDGLTLLFEALLWWLWLWLACFFEGQRVPTDRYMGLFECIWPAVPCQSLIWNGRAGSDGFSRIAKFCALSSGCKMRHAGIIWEQDVVFVVTFSQREQPDAVMADSWGHHVV